jgi:hypothetical protein
MVMLDLGQRAYHAFAEAWVVLVYFVRKKLELIPSFVMIFN